MVSISVPIVNTALNNSTTVRTDTFPYGTSPSFLRKFPIENLRSDPGASYGTVSFESPISVPIINTILNNSITIRTDTFPYGTVPSEIQYGASPLRPDALQ